MTLPRHLSPILLAVSILASSVSHAAAFTFMVYGDSRADGKACTGNEIHEKLLARMAAVPAIFVANTGDMITGFGPTTNFANDGACPGPRGRGSLKALVEPIQSRKPPQGVPMSFIPVVGNHDDNWGSKWYPDPFNGTFCDAFDVQKLIPNHTRASWYKPRKPERLSDAEFYQRLCSPTDKSVYPRLAYYSFSHADAHFIVLRINNDNFALDACNGCRGDRTDYDDYYNIHQLHFLEADLAAARKAAGTKAIFVFLHAPVFGSSGHPGTASWKTLGEVFTRHKVTAVFSGHNHVYERTHGVRIDARSPEGVRDDAVGTFYVTTGGGGAPLHDFKGAAPWWSAARKPAFNYVEVRVDGEKLEMIARDADGAVIDTVRR